MIQYITDSIAQQISIALIQRTDFVPANVQSAETTGKGGSDGSDDSEDDSDPWGCDCTFDGLGTCGKDNGNVCDCVATFGASESCDCLIL